MKKIFKYIKYTIEARAPLPVYWEMRKGIWKVIKKRLLKNNYKIIERPKITIDKLRYSLLKVGLRKSDTVFVHSGIGNIGIFEGGRKKIFEILLDIIDIDKGNILFPTFSFFPRMIDYLESNPIFDVRSAPSYMGSLTQYALKSGMGKRSINPTHSVLCIGKDQDWLAGEHHLCKTPFCDKSPFYRYLKLKNAKILLIGVDTDAITTIHAVEDSINFPINVYTSKIYNINCINWFGEKIIVETRSHNPVVSLSRNTRRFDEIFREKCFIGEEKIGLGKITLIDAKKFFDLLVELAKSGYTVYGKTKLF